MFCNKKKVFVNHWHLLAFFYKNDKREVREVALFDLKKLIKQTKKQKYKTNKVEMENPESRQYSVYFT